MTIFTELKLEQAIITLLEESKGTDLNDSSFFMHVRLWPFTAGYYLTAPVRSDDD